MPQRLCHLHKLLARMKNAKNTQDHIPLFLGTQELAPTRYVPAGALQASFGIKGRQVGQQKTCDFLIFRHQLWRSAALGLLMGSRLLKVGRGQLDPFLCAQFVNKLDQLLTHGFRVLSFQCCSTTAFC